MTTGERKEDVVETRFAHGELDGLDTLVVERAQGLHEGAGTVGDFEVQHASILAGWAHAEGRDDACGA
jgi:hypothetical protein